MTWLEDEAVPLFSLPDKSRLIFENRLYTKYNNLILDEESLIVRYMDNTELVVPVEL